MQICGEMVARQRRDLESIDTRVMRSTTAVKSIKHFNTVLKYLLITHCMKHSSGENTEEIKAGVFVFQLLTIRQYRKNWQSRIIFVKYFNVQLSRKQNGLMRMQPKGMLKKKKERKKFQTNHLFNF
jgi:hypothetical protein